MVNGSTITEHLPVGRCVGDYGWLRYVQHGKQGQVASQERQHCVVCECRELCSHARSRDEVSAVQSRTACRRHLEVRQLMRALCGVRRAALLFQEYVVQAMEQFNTHFFHSSWEVVAAAHGEDSSQQATWHPWTDLMKRLILKGDTSTGNKRFGKGAKNAEGELGCTTS